MVGHVFRLARSAIREKLKAHKRSPKWKHVRALHISQHPSCAACGSIKHLQVHHVEPFHLKPRLELDHTNLMTLCMDKHECHERLGHGDNFRAYNPKIRLHAALLMNDPVNVSLRRRLEAEAKDLREYTDFKV